MLVVVEVLGLEALEMRRVRVKVKVRQGVWFVWLGEEDRLDEVAISQRSKANDSIVGVAEGVSSSDQCFWKDCSGPGMRYKTLI